MSAAPITGVDRSLDLALTTDESSQSAVSWAAIFSGSVVAVAVTLVLVALGAGLGLTSISPWPNEGVSAKTFAISTGIGLIVVQWLAAGTGGYIAGRLRTKWVGVHTHEVFFRDTAHGFLVWALATFVGSVFLTSAASSIVGGGVDAAATVAGGAAQGGTQSAMQSPADFTSYDVDSLFRSDHMDQAANGQASEAQAARILGYGIANGGVSAQDRAYLAQLVAARTGISPQDAQKRVDDVLAREQAVVVKAKQVADAARKASAQLAIFTALSMLIGAFIASAAAAYGGSLRDENELTR
jgi:hypothetical protein